MVRLLFFGKLAEVAGARERNHALSTSMTVDALIDGLEEMEPYLAAELREETVRYVVNETIASGDRVISDDDEIAFIPPFSGG